MAENNEKKVIRYKLVKHKWPDEIKQERNRRIKRVTIIFACVLCFGFGFGANMVLGVRSSMNDDPTAEKFQTIYDIMSDQWYFGKDVENLDETLMNDAINGMVNNPLDLHTNYMSKEQALAFSSSLQGNFVGIGIQYYAEDNDNFIIDRVFKNSPAEAAGMMKGDSIIMVDNIDCSGKEIQEISDMIKGEIGSVVQIRVMREGKPVDLSITRDVVNDSVFGYAKETTGILEITSFAETSGEETGKYLKDFHEKGYENLVIDLRDNGGGYLVAAQKIASYLVPADTPLYQQKNKAGEVTETKTIPDYPVYEFKNIVILINEETASASEVLTLTLQEKANAKVVGVQSYGKGTAQVPIPFKDGSSLKYTAAEWLSPNGNSINGVGVTPDYVVELDAAITTSVAALADGEEYKENTVSTLDGEVVYGKHTVSVTKAVQVYLKFLGYAVDRTDEYFSAQSAQALRQYQRDTGLAVTGVINEDIVKSLLSSCSIKWHNEESTLDLQMLKALEVASQ